MSIGINASGFDELENALEQASKDCSAAAKRCAEDSAAVMQMALQKAMRSADKTGNMVGLISRMPPPKIERKADGTYAVSVGYEKDGYDPADPSDAYQVAFLNYGTPERSKHGKVTKRGFIAKAKRSAKRKIETIAEETLNDVIKEINQ